MGGNCIMITLCENNIPFPESQNDFNENYT